MGRVSELNAEIQQVLTRLRPLQDARIAEALKRDADEAFLGRVAAAAAPLEAELLALRAQRAEALDREQGTRVQLPGIVAISGAAASAGLSLVADAATCSCGAADDDGDFDDVDLHMGAGNIVTALGSADSTPDTRVFVEDLGAAIARALHPAGSRSAEPVLLREVPTQAAHFYL